MTTKFHVYGFVYSAETAAAEHSDKFIAPHALRRWRASADVYLCRQTRFSVSRREWRGQRTDCRHLVEGSLKLLSGLRKTPQKLCRLNGVPGTTGGTVLADGQLNNRVEIVT